MAYRDQFKSFAVEAFVGEDLASHMDFASLDAALQAFNERKVAAEEEIQLVTDTGEVVAFVSSTESYRSEIFFCKTIS